LGNSATTLAPNGDGLNLIANYLQWINPDDYYNGALPNIQIVSGNYQNGPAGMLLPLPLTVQITSASGGAPLANAPGRLPRFPAAANWPQAPTGLSRLL
jgi:hypothetical protein